MDLLKEIKHLSNIQDNVLYDITLVLELLEDINYHTERREIFEIVPVHLQKKLNKLEVLDLIWRKNTYQEWKWQQLKEAYNFNEEEHKKFIEYWDLSLWKWIIITKYDMFYYKAGLSDSRTLWRMIWWGLKTWEADKIILFIKERLWK